MSTRKKSHIAIGVLGTAAIVSAIALGQTAPKVGSIDQRAAGMFEAGLVPIGGVIAFWGTREEAMRLGSFELCDGTPVAASDSPIKGRSKPNMQDRFIMGTVDAPDVAGSPISGGANAIPDRPQGATGDTTLTIEQMPAHDHGGNTGDKGPWSINTDGGRLVRSDGNSTPSGMDGTKGELNCTWSGSRDPGQVPAHNHPISAQGGNKPHSHTLPAVPGHDNRPQFQAMYYIIRVK